MARSNPEPTDVLKQTFEGEKRRAEGTAIDVSYGETADGHATVKVEWSAGETNLPGATWESAHLPDGVDIVSAGTCHYDKDGTGNNRSQPFISVILKDTSEDQK